MFKINLEAIKMHFLTRIINLEKHALVASNRVSLLCYSVTWPSNLYKLPDVYTSLLQSRLKEDNNMS